MLAAAAAALLLCAAPARAQQCPKGTVDVGNGRCVRDMSRGGRGSPFIDMRAGHFRGARCPVGTHTVESPVGFRCVMGSGDGDKPAPGRDRSGRGKLRRDGQAEDEAQAPVALVQPPARTAPAPVPAAEQPPLEKVLASDKPVPEEKPAPAGPPREFVPFRAKGLSVSLPRGWHVTDAWSDAVPTVYVELDAKRRGKPVTMLVSKIAPGQEGYEPLADAVAKEKEYQGAREGAPRKVSGLDARQTLVAGESRSAYVDAGGGAYYLLSYSAPKDVFSVYEPAFERLLSSARLAVP